MAVGALHKLLKFPLAWVGVLLLALVLALVVAAALRCCAAFVLAAAHGARHCSHHCVSLQCNTKHWHAKTGACTRLVHDWRSLSIGGRGDVFVSANTTLKINPYPLQLLEGRLLEGGRQKMQCKCSLTEQPVTALSATYTHDSHCGSCSVLHDTSHHTRLLWLCGSRSIGAWLRSRRTNIYEKEMSKHTRNTT